MIKKINTFKAGQILINFFSVLQQLIIFIQLMSINPAFNINRDYLSSLLFCPQKPRIGATTYLNVNILPDFVQYIKKNLTSQQLISLSQYQLQTYIMQLSIKQKVSESFQNFVNKIICHMRERKQFWLNEKILKTKQNQEKQEEEKKHQHQAISQFHKDVQLINKKIPYFPQKPFNNYKNRKIHTSFQNSNLQYLDKGRNVLKINFTNYSMMPAYVLSSYFQQTMSSKKWKQYDEMPKQQKQLLKKLQSAVEYLLMSQRPRLNKKNNIKKRELIRNRLVPSYLQRKEVLYGGQCNEIELSSYQRQSSHIEKENEQGEQSEQESQNEFYHDFHKRIERKQYYDSKMFTKQSQINQSHNVLQILKCLLYVMRKQELGWFQKTWMELEEQRIMRERKYREEEEESSIEESSVEEEKESLIEEEKEGSMQEEKEKSIDEDKKMQIEKEGREQVQQLDNNERKQKMKMEEEILLGQELSQDPCKESIQSKVFNCLPHQTEFNQAPQQTTFQAPEVAQQEAQPLNTSVQMQNYQHQTDQRKINQFIQQLSNTEGANICSPQNEFKNHQKQTLLHNQHFEQANLIQHKVSQIFKVKIIPQKSQENIQDIQIGIKKPIFDQNWKNPQFSFKKLSKNLHDRFLSMRQIYFVTKQLCDTEILLKFQDQHFLYKQIENKSKSIENSLISTQISIDQIYLEFKEMIEHPQNVKLSLFKTQGITIPWQQTDYLIFLKGLLEFFFIPTNNRKIALFMMSKNPKKNIQANHVKYVKGIYLKNMLIRIQRGESGGGKKGRMLGKTQFLQKDIEFFSMRWFDKLKKSKKKKNRRKFFEEDDAAQEIDSAY